MKGVTIMGMKKTANIKIDIAKRGNINVQQTNNQNQPVANQQMRTPQPPPPTKPSNKPPANRRD